MIANPIKKQSICDRFIPNRKISNLLSKYINFINF